MAARGASAAARADAAHRCVDAIPYRRPEAQTGLAAFLQGMQQLGWTEGGNLQVEYRWSGGDAERLRTYAAELVALAPDVILATGATVGALLQVTQSIPIVFTIAADPVGRGFVESLARPG